MQYDPDRPQRDADLARAAAFLADLAARHLTDDPASPEESRVISIGVKSALAPLAQARQVVRSARIRAMRVWTPLHA